MKPEVATTSVRPSVHLLHWSSTSSFFIYIKFWYRSYLQKFVECMWLSWKPAKWQLSCLRASITFYLVFHIFCLMWGISDRKDLNVIILNICECSGYMCREWHIWPRDAKKIFHFFFFYIFRPIWIKFSRRGPQKLLDEWGFVKIDAIKGVFYILA